ncbi:MAG: anaerobic ribonucleoside-triphosphate reductase activating protein [Lachnospiraceae bacterium]|nr:anaerobic ribonucleoside-triphosphate reductase activating protein [Lachnospiraceae bacterium]
MNYGAIKKTDVANGPGIRVSLFVSGCTHGCKGCFNREAWDFKYGREFTKQAEGEIMEALSPSYIRGLSVLGGEPMEPQNRGEVLSLLRKVRERYPEKDIWCYTGYVYEKDLLRWIQEENAQEVAELLSLIDVLVDGAFVEERKNLRLAFRGSENQRLIDVKESLRLGSTIMIPS